LSEEEAERVYTIPLGKVLLSPHNQRSKRAINVIKEFTRHHMKTEQVKIDQDVSHQIWARGIRHPPRKIRVRMAKDEDGLQERPAAIQRDVFEAHLLLGLVQGSPRVHAETLNGVS